MELIEIRQIYHNKEQYMGKKIRVGGWVRSIRTPSLLVLLCYMMGPTLIPCRWFIMIGWIIFRKYQSLM